MTIIDLVEDAIRDNLGEDMLTVLRIYEDTYPPDWAFKLVPDAGSLMDFDIQGGDIGLVGFWYNATVESVIALATQDLIMRLLINDSMSRFISDYGIGPIDEIPRETLKAAVLLAANGSPYIAEVKDVQIIEGDNIDALRIIVNALTPTGESVGLDLKNIGG